MARPAIKWLLVEWNTGELEVVSVKSVVKTGLKLSDLTTGKLITVMAAGQGEKPAKIVMSSDDRKFLQQQIHPMTVHKKEHVEVLTEMYPKIYEDAEQIKSPAKDFSPSTSSWTAEEWDTTSSSSSEEEVLVKNIKKEKVKRNYTRREKSGKVPAPTLKLQPIIPNSIKINGSTSICDQSVIQRKYSLPDRVFMSKLNMSDSSLTIGQNSRKRMMYDQQVQTDPIILPSRGELDALQKELQCCREIIHNTKEVLAQISPLLNTVNVLNVLTANTNTKSNSFFIENNQTIAHNNGTISQNNGTISQNNGTISQNNEFGNKLELDPLEASIGVDETFRDLTNSLKKRSKKRKCETLLNKVKVENKTPSPAPIILNSTLGYINNAEISPRIAEPNNQLEVTKNSINGANETVEMVIIGSGKTFIHKSIYDEINWSSYTMATRKLLMAVFPRNVLATHSLTGKSSPAFMNKPPKLSLDPRKVSDIVWTVTKNCKVKENLVRSAITIKCADENKMMKFQNLKKSAKKSKKKQETFNGDSNSD